MGQRKTNIGERTNALLKIARNVPIFEQGNLTSGLVNW